MLLVVEFFLHSAPLGLLVVWQCFLWAKNKLGMRGGGAVGVYQTDGNGTLEIMTNPRRIIDLMVGASTPLGLIGDFGERMKTLNINPPRPSKRCAARTTRGTPASFSPTPPTALTRAPSQERVAHVGQTGFWDLRSP